MRIVKLIGLRLKGPSTLRKHAAAKNGLTLHSCQVMPRWTTTRPRSPRDWPAGRQILAGHVT
jgi:hypothetical protein